MTEKYIDTPRGRVYYWKKEGNPNQAIFFAHGMTADHRLFDHQITPFSQEYTVLVWDMPLHGKSRPYVDFTWDNLAEDMRAICKAEGLTEVILAGQSAGGYACQAFIRKYPRMSRAFIAIGTSPLDESYYSKNDLYWVLHFPDVAVWYPYPLFCMASARLVATTPEARQSFYDTLIELDRDGMLLATQCICDALPAALGTVNFPCPVLLIMGEKDKMGTIAKLNQQWTQRSGFPLVVIPGAGHNVNDDAPEAFNTAVFDFLHRRLRRK